MENQEQKKLKTYRRLMIVFWILVPGSNILLGILGAVLDKQFDKLSDVIWIFPLLAAIVLTVLFSKQKKAVKAANTNVPSTINAPFNVPVNAPVQTPVNINPYSAAALWQEPHAAAVESTPVRPEQHETVESTPVRQEQQETDEIASGRRELNEEEGIAFINRLDEVFVMYSAATGEGYPSVDMTGSAWVFSKVEFAEYSQQQNAAFHLKYCAMSLQAFKAFVREWYAYGIYRFKLNPGINDAYAEIQRDRFVPNADAKMFDYYGSNFNQLILRFKQMYACKENPIANAFANTLWSSICHELYNNVYLVPIAYDNEPDDAVDPYIHYTENARQTVNDIEVNRELGESIQDGKTLHVSGDVILANEKLILGVEGYRLATPETSVGGRIMHLRTLRNGNISMLCAFTDVRDMHRIFGPNLHIALMTYQDIVAHKDDPISDGNQINGIVINPIGLTLELDRENIAYAEKEHQGPVKLFVSE